MRRVTRPGAIFAAAAAADPRFRVVTQDRRRGLGAARNAGLDLVDTEFVASSTPTTCCGPRPSNVSSGVLRASGSDFAAGAYVRLRPDGRRLCRGRGAAVGGRGHEPRAHRDHDRRPPAGVLEHRRLVEGQPRVVLAPRGPALPGGEALRRPGRRAADVLRGAVVRRRARRRGALAHPRGRLIDHPARGGPAGAARRPRRHGRRARDPG